MNPDGVGCESCHGPAAKWLGLHTTGAWKGFDPDTKEKKFGFVPTQLLARRAEVCVACHVGRHAADDLPLQDVNHDLIAAGHPRLAFEFTAYQDRMPAHWVEKGRNAAPDFAAWAWAVGQLVSAKAALELLQGRAKDKAAPWPEFSEYDCYACHHNLVDAVWRRNSHPRPSLPAISGWGSWYFSITSALIGQNLAAGPAGGPVVDRPFADLHEAMSRMFPDKPRVEIAVNRGICLLDCQLAGLSEVMLAGPTVERVIRAFNGPKAWDTVSCWDQAAQRYLALVPLNHTWKRLACGDHQKQQKLAQELRGLLEKLRFKRKLNSPRDYDPASVRP
jgi:hypothetical protein